MYLKNRNKKGFTLIEVILALTLGALILASLTVIFEISSTNWRQINQKREIIQHARIAMIRLTDELRYTIRLNDSGSPNILEFYTRKLINDDWSPTWMKYELNTADNLLYRTAGPYSPYPIAGSTTEYISVTGFNYQPLKIDAGGNLVQLITTDPIDKAVAVNIGLTLSDIDGDTFTLETTVMFRNRFPRETV